jgi:hypothetical protein
MRMKFTPIGSIAEQFFWWLRARANDDFYQKDGIALKFRQQKRKTAPWRDSEISSVEFLFRGARRAEN